MTTAFLRLMLTLRNVLPGFCESRLDRAIERVILPASRCHALDSELELHLKGDPKAAELFGDPPKPSRKIKQMIREFIFRVGRIKTSGRNFLEIGAGAGGVSFAARRMGMNVVATDIDLNGFPDAWIAARRVLGVASSEFVFGATPLADIARFPDQRRIDVLYLDGVPFNKNVPDGFAYLEGDGQAWYDAGQWRKAIDDIDQALSPGGWYLQYMVTGLDDALIAQVRRHVEDELGNRIEFRPSRRQYRDMPSYDIAMRKRAA